MRYSSQSLSLPDFLEYRSNVIWRQTIPPHHEMHHGIRHHLFE